MICRHRSAEPIDRHAAHESRRVYRCDRDGATPAGRTTPPNCRGCPFGPKPPTRSRGLGDTIAKLTKRLGIKRKPGCGCGKRQAALNRLVPYRGIMPTD